jgi:putative acetyltransferase
MDLPVRIIEYEPRFRGAFRAINMEWIRDTFVEEKHDIEVLGDPEAFVLSLFPTTPGVILMAVTACVDQPLSPILPQDDEDDVSILGAVALVPLSATPTATQGPVEQQGFELAKMGVRSSVRGRGVGRALAMAAMDRARALGAPVVHIWSNRVLEPALKLYRSLGFFEVPLERDTVFARANIRLRCDLG